jgi:cob(I)alamin adenosyltransferase
MKIYTKRGDEGETGLYGGDRVPKDHFRIRSYGTLDELNAALGVVLASMDDSTKSSSAISQRLVRIQGELFQLGAELATPRGKRVSTQVISAADITRLEGEIDEMEKNLPPLQTFILPGGTPGAAHLHLARTICRRAEREIVILHRAEPLPPHPLQYVNRLSDYLFVAARFLNHRAGQPDVPWMAPPAPAP